LNKKRAAQAGTMKLRRRAAALHREQTRWREATAGSRLLAGPRREWAAPITTARPDLYAASMAENAAYAVVLADKRATEARKKRVPKKGGSGRSGAGAAETARAL
jgi:hypothetical protein